jgi:hypothetical protein
MEQKGYGHSQLQEDRCLMQNCEAILRGKTDKKLKFYAIAKNESTCLVLTSGGGGIRTHEALSSRGLAIRCTRPLCDSSKWNEESAQVCSLAEGESLLMRLLQMIFFVLSNPTDPRTM